MSTNLYLLLLLFVLISYTRLEAQVVDMDTTDLTFTGAKFNSYDEKFDTTGRITFSGYIDTYYSYYADTLGLNGFAKFPTGAPRHNQFGLNVLQFSVNYYSNKFRATGTVFFGDIATSSWSPKLNFVQEANAGFRIYKKLWIDAGFFRTHIGLESIQPRENITSSFATLSYFESYYMSGAKLTWQESKKWTFQVNAFNGFNNFIDNNDNKALGIAINFKPSKLWSFTLNSLVCDEYPSDAISRHLRHYTNFVSTYKNKKIRAGIEANFGYQENSNVIDTTKLAFIVSGAFVLKYRITNKWATYGRFELFSDPNQVLTGAFVNNKNEVTGLNIIGGTFGIEFKPIPNAYFRVESRLLRTKRNEQIFYYNNAALNYRWEGTASIGVWF